MALALLGAGWLLIRGRPDWLWPMLSLPVLLTFFHLFFHAKDRFHIPLDAVIALFAAVAIRELGALLRRGSFNDKESVAVVRRDQLGEPGISTQPRLKPEA
jgi:hypothetical protein